MKLSFLILKYQSGLQIFTLYATSWPCLKVIGLIGSKLEQCFLFLDSLRFLKHGINYYFQTNLESKLETL